MNQRDRDRQAARDAAACIEAALLDPDLPESERQHWDATLRRLRRLQRDLDRWTPAEIIPWAIAAGLALYILLRFLI